MTEEAEEPSWFETAWEDTTDWLTGLKGKPGANEININPPKETLESAIDLFYNEKITTSFASQCVNSVRLVNIKNCDLGDIEQICEAQAVGDTLVQKANQQEFQLTAVQKLYDMIKKSADDELDRIYEQQVKTGEVLMSSAGENEQVTYNQMANTISKMAIKSSISLVTICTRQASGSNRVDLEDIDCQGESIEFGKQTSRVKVIGDCIINSQALGGTGGEASDEYRDLVAYQKFFEPFVEKSGTIYKVFYIVLGITALFLVLGVIFVRAMRPRDPRNTRMAAPLMLGIILLYAVGLSMCLWWPGFYSVTYGVWPWPYPHSQVLGSNGEPICSNGELSTPSYHVNELPWVGNFCAGEDGLVSDGPECKNVPHQYETCGILGGCDDPRLESDKTDWLAANAACDAAPLDVVRSCTPSAIFDATVMGPFYGCHSCSDSGLPAFVKDGVSCTDADIDTATLKSYAAYEDIIQVDGSIAPARCDPDDLINGTCYESKAEYEANVSAHECLNGAYMLRKKIMVDYVKACDKVAETTRTPDADFRDQCPPKVADFLDCDPKTNTCNYTAVDGANSASCSNSLEGCEDPAYLVDLSRDDAMRFKCKEEYDQWKMMNKWPVIITVVVYLLLICIAAGLVWYGSSNQLVDPLPPIGHGFTWYTRINVPTWVFLLVLLLLVAAFSVVGPPFGLMGAAYSMGPLYNEESYPEASEDFDESEMQTQSIVYTVIASVLIFSWISLFINIRVAHSRYTNQIKMV
jgi:hypothetical protein